MTTGPWTPVPMITAAVGASNPVGQAWFDAIVASTVASLRAALAGDRSMRCSCRCTARPSRPSSPIRMARCSPQCVVVSDTVPVLATLDLRQCVEGDGAPRRLSLGLSHQPARRHPRGAAPDVPMRYATHWRAAVAGIARSMKLPFIPPSVTQNTERKPGAEYTGNGDIIHYGQSHLNEDVRKRGRAIGLHARRYTQGRHEA